MYNTVQYYSNNYSINTVLVTFIFVTMLQVSDVPKNQRLRYIQAVLEEHNITAQQAHLAQLLEGDRTKTGNINKIFKGNLSVSDSNFEVFLQHYPAPPQWWEEQKAMPTGGVRRTLKDYLEHIEGENQFLRRLVDSALTDIAASVKGIVKERISSGAVETAPDKKKAIVDPKALSPVVPAPPLDTPGGNQAESKGNIHAKGKQNKR